MSKVIHYNLEGNRIHRWLKTIPVYGIPYWQCAVTESVLEYLKGDLHSSDFRCNEGVSIYYNPKSRYSIHFYVTDKMKDQKQLVLQPFNGLCTDEKIEINITIPNLPKDTLVCDSFQPTERFRQAINGRGQLDTHRVKMEEEVSASKVTYNPLPSFKKIIGRLYWKK